MAGELGVQGGEQVTTARACRRFLDALEAGDLVRQGRADLVGQRSGSGPGAGGRGWFRRRGGMRSVDRV
jgi:hypothetical protein